MERNLHECVPPPCYPIPSAAFATPPPSHGQPPFYDSNNVMAIYQQILAGRYEMAPFLSSAVRGVIKGCLLKSLSRRPTAAALAEHEWLPRDAIGRASGVACGPTPAESFNDNFAAVEATNDPYVSAFPPPQKSKSGKSSRQ